MLTKEQKIKLIVDIKKGKVSKQIIQFAERIVFAEPDIFAINSICFDEPEYEKVINYLTSLNTHIILVRNMSRKNI